VISRAAHLVLGGAAAAVDRAAKLAADAQIAKARRRNVAESLPHEERILRLGELLELYRDPRAAAYFREPRRIEPVERVVREGPGGERVVDVSWPSHYECFLPDLSERFSRYRQNTTAGARLFLRGAPRPIAILIHGYMAGQYAVEQRVWPIPWLSRIGLDAALFVLPFHGIRANPRRRVPPFPGSDPRLSNEGFRQAMADLRDFVAWLRERGHRAVGVMGMSLGGYSTALACTTEPSLAFGVPIIPLASLADFARDQGRLGTTPAETALEHRALDDVHGVVSPLARPALLPRERLLVVAAKADRITPLSHARRLAHHFGAPLEAIPGGHLLQFGRANAFRRIGRLLDDLELTSRR
jgi:pimeloyl-ACP methyl ester carboxylesterase